jgi:Ricin-type beta-trefoil lectin domain
MKRLSHLGFNMAVTVLLAAGAIAASSATASASTTFASCSAQGDYAICDASGTATSPVTLTVTVTSSPDQQVFVAWDTTCSEGLSVGGSSGTFTAQTPVTRTISHPYYQPDSCIVSADAQLQAGGNSVHVSLSYSRAAPPPAPATHEVKGYSGMCADDQGDSSARGAKIVTWKCSSSDAAQSWKFSGGKLIHGSLCANDKASGGSGSPVILYTCTSGANDLWTHNSHGEYVLKAHGGTLCLDDPAYSKRNGTQLIVYMCKDSANQHWSLP